MPMDEIVEQGRGAWRWLDGEWHQVQEQWHGVTHERFASQFWDQLDDETRDFLRALDHLAEALEDARRIADIR